MWAAAIQQGPRAAECYLLSLLRTDQPLVQRKSLRHIVCACQVQCSTAKLYHAAKRCLATQALWRRLCRARRLVVQMLVRYLAAAWQHAQALMAQVNAQQSSPTSPGAAPQFVNVDAASSCITLLRKAAGAAMFLSGPMHRRISAELAGATLPRRDVVTCSTTPQHNEFVSLPVCCADELKLSFPALHSRLAC